MTQLAVINTSELEQLIKQAVSAAVAPAKSLGVAEAAAFLGVNQQRVRELAREGIIPGQNIGLAGREHWRFSAGELERWLAKK